MIFVYISVGILTLLLGGLFGVLLLGFPLGHALLASFVGYGIIVLFDVARFTLKRRKS